MHAKDLFFVIPTYRLREVGETVQAYDEHFRRNGHTVRMLVFDFAGSRLLFDGRLYENPVTKREHSSSTPVHQRIRT
jgi:hypothetical protein